MQLIYIQGSLRGLGSHNINLAIDGEQEVKDPIGRTE
jgi:hypothetical protein